MGWVHTAGWGWSGFLVGVIIVFVTGDKHQGMGSQRMNYFMQV